MDVSAQSFWFKADGSQQLVINLRPLNKFIIDRHFKMESVRSIRGLVQRGDWLLKLDLKDAYQRTSNTSSSPRRGAYGNSRPSPSASAVLKPVLVTLRKLAI